MTTALNRFSRCGSVEASGGSDRARRTIAASAADFARYAKTIIARSVITGDHNRIMPGFEYLGNGKIAKKRCARFLQRREAGVCRPSIRKGV